MLMTQFERWYAENQNKVVAFDEQNFEEFFIKEYKGKSFMEILASLAYQIHDLQVVVEGLIEDKEYEGNYL